MKDWPDDREPISNLDKLLGPLVEIFEEVYDTDVEVPEDLEYDGYDHGELHTTPSLKTLLSKEWQEKEVETREFHVQLLHAAYMIGIENGKRFEADSDFERKAKKAMVEIAELREEFEDQLDGTED